MKPDRVRLGLLMLLVSLGCWAGCCGDNCAGVDDTDFTAERSFHFRFAAGDWDGFELEGATGDIHIIEVAGSDSIVIAGVRRVRSDSPEDAEEHLHLVQVSVQDLSTEVLVRTDQPDEAHGRIYEVDYDVSLPRGMDISIVGVNGMVVLQGIFGSTGVHLVNGEIEGDVTMPSGGAIGMDVANGVIELGIPESTSAEFLATVVNGSIDLTGLLLHDRECTAFALAGTLGSGDGTIALAAVNGNISVTGFE